MEIITVVGVGPGNRDYLLPAALKAIENAEVLVGGQRLLDMFPHPSEREEFIVRNNLNEMVSFIRERRDKQRVVVLTSGDPGFYGILTHLRRHFKAAELKVIPGISSVQLACARLATPWHDAILISCHGRPCDHLVDTVQVYPKVITLTGPGSSPEKLARQLVAGGLGNRKVDLCCQLSYDYETIASLTVAELAARDESGDANCVMVITHG